MKPNFIIMAAALLALTANAAQAQPKVISPTDTQSPARPVTPLGNPLDTPTGTPNMTRMTPPPSNMNPDQFSTFATGRWDFNNDGIISRTEWDSINPSWFSLRSPETFTSLDMNRNGILDSTELSSFFSNSSLFQIYDTNRDGRIDSTEASRIP